MEQTSARHPHIPDALSITLPHRPAMAKHSVINGLVVRIIRLMFINYGGVK